MDKACHSCSDWWHVEHRCFEETNRLNIQTAATWLPRSCFGFGAAFCAYLRMMVVALFICWQGRSTGSAFDCVIVDQVEL